MLHCVCVCVCVCVCASTKTCSRQRADGTRAGWVGAECQGREGAGAQGEGALRPHHGPRVLGITSPPHPHNLPSRGGRDAKEARGKERGAKGARGGQFCREGGARERATRTDPLSCISSGSARGRESRRRCDGEAVSADLAACVQRDFSGYLPRRSILCVSQIGASRVF